MPKSKKKKGKMVKRKKIRNKVVTMHEMMMIDEAKSWTEIVRIEDKKNYKTSRIFDRGVAM